MQYTIWGKGDIKLNINRRMGQIVTEYDKSNEHSDKALIDLAYTLAVEPQRYQHLSNLLDARINYIRNSKNKDEEQEKLNALAPHFERAFDLIDRQGRRFNYATGSKRFVASDIRPSLLIYPNGTIFFANTAAQSSLSLSKETSLNAEIFEHGHFDRLCRDLKSLSDHDVDKIIGVYSIFEPGSDQVLKMALSRAIDFDGNPIGRLCTFHVKWVAEMESEFKAAFRLTPVEIEITKAVISGMSLNELAEQRGRSLATLRTQTKILLGKLDLKSKTELACIYSGFAQYNRQSVDETSAMHPLQATTRHHRHLTLPDGRNLHYEIAGVKTGRPVLFFCGLIGGHILSAATLEGLKQRKIKLIMVWRPGFAQSTHDKGGRSAPKRFAYDVKFLLQNLGIASVQILANISGSIYAFACAKYLENMVSGIVTTAGAVPIVSSEHFTHMTQASRVALIVARYSPKLLPMLLRAFLSKIDAGYDEEFMQQHYEQSPPDLSVVDDPEYKFLIRHEFPLITSSGYSCFTSDIRQQARKWTYLIKDVHCPVTMLQGEDDPSYPYKIVKKFARVFANIIVVPVADAAQLVFYQHPNTVFDALDTQYRAEPQFYNNVVPFPSSQQL